MARSNQRCLDDRYARHSLVMSKSDGELRRWAHEHLVYEAAMLNHVAGKFANPRLSDQDHNAFLESFAVHVRCLRDFLWNDRKHRQEDAFASDFCDLGVWEAKRGDLPAALGSIEGNRQRIGREIVHLTYHRLTISDETREWELTELVRAIAEGLHKFAEAAKPERLHPKTREALALSPKDVRILLPKNPREGRPISIAASIPVTGATQAFEGFTARSLDLEVD